MKKNKTAGRENLNEKKASDVTHDLREKGIEEDVSDSIEENGGGVEQEIPRKVVEIAAAERSDFKVRSQRSTPSEDNQSDEDAKDEVSEADNEDSHDGLLWWWLGGAALAGGIYLAAKDDDGDEVAPTITSSSLADSIDENSSAGQIVYTATSTDNQKSSEITYSLKEVGDHQSFRINSDTGEVTLTESPDHEAKSTYSLTVVATDESGNSSEKIVSLSINDLDEVAPRITSSTSADSIDENSGAGQVVYTATSDDSADVSGGVRYSLKEDGDHGSFSIDADTGEVTFTNDPDYEAQSSYSFTIVVTDAAGNSSEQSITLSINDLNEGGSTSVTGVVTDGPIEGAKLYIDENGNGIYDEGEQPFLDENGNHVTTDSNGLFDFVTEENLSTLKLVAHGGVDTVTGEASHLNFSAPVGYQVLNPITSCIAAYMETNPDVTAAEAEAAVEEALGLPDLDYSTVNLADPGADLDAQKAAAVVATVAIVAAQSGVNSEDAFAYVTENLGAGGSTNELVQTISSEAEVSGTEIQEQLQETVDAVQEASSLNEVNNGLNDNLFANLTVEGQLLVGQTLTGEVGLGQSTNLEITYQWQLSEDGGATWADISGETGVNYQITADEAGDYLRLVASYTDTYGESQIVYSNAQGPIVVSNANAPVLGADTTVLIDENAANGTVVADVDAQDADGDTITYSIIEGNESGAFSIDRSTGEITVADKTQLDYESQTRYVLKVEASDGSKTDSSTVTVNLNDVDEVNPDVASVAITSAIGAQNNTLDAGDVVSVTVTMNEATTVTGTPQLALNIGGTIVQADYVSGSGTTALVFKYTITNENDANGISIDANSLSLNGGTLQDAAGNDAALTHSSVADNTNYMVDTSTGVGSVEITDATGAQNNTLNAGDVVSVTVTMDEATTVTGTPQLALNIGGTIVQADYVSGSGTTALVFKYTITNENDANGISIDANSLSLNGGTLQDAAGNDVLLTHSAVSDNGGYMVDTTAPGVDSIAIVGATGAQNNTLNAGDVVSVMVTMDDATTVTGTPQLALNIGGTIVQADYVSGSGTIALVFQYTISSETDVNGISIDANSLSLNGGTLQSAIGNDATLTHSAVVDNSNYMVDTTSPEITQVSVPNALMAVGDTVTVTITVADDGGDTYTNLSGNVGGFNLSNLTRVNSTTYTAEFTVAHGGTSVIAGADIPVDISLDDRAGNSTSYNTAISQNSDPIDANAPVITGVSIADTSMKVGDTVVVTITVQDDGGEVFQNIQGTVGGYNLSSLGRTNGTTYTAQFTVTEGGTDVAAGSDIPVSVTMDDQNGGTSNTYTTPLSQGNDSIDANSPDLDSVSPADGATGVGSNNNLVLSFDENVSVGSGNLIIYDENDNVFETIDITDGSKVAVSANQVTINPAGTFANNTGYYVQYPSTAFEDANGNTTAAISDKTTWNFNTPDTVDPTVSSFSSSTVDGSYKAGDTINITATCDESIKSGSTLTVTLDTGDTVLLTASSDGTTLTGTYTVGAGDISSDLTVSSFTIGTVQDLAGNNMTDTTVPVGASNIAGSSAIVIDTTAPVISSVSIPNSAMNVGDTVIVTLTVADDGGDTYTNLSGSVGGFALSNLNKTNNTTYTAQFTVTEGGTDVAAGSDIPVNLTLDDSTGNTSSSYTTAISQGGDSIDANTPATPGLALATDTGNSSSDGITSDNTVNVSGLEAGVSWEYSLDNGSTWNNGSGSSFELTNNTSYSAGHIQVRQTDAAGNTSDVGSIASAVSTDNTVATPSIALANDSGVNSDGITNDATVNVTGLEAGASWEYSLDDGLNWNNGSGASFELGGNATYSAGHIQVRQTDVAGNVSSIGSIASSITTDTTVPVISNVTIPNATMNVGDIVTVTLTVSDDGGNAYTNLSGTVGGFALSDLNKTNNTTYTAKFTVTEGGTDVAAGSSIPVSITLDDLAGNTSSTYDTAISQASDAIDANSPEVDSIAISGATGVQNNTLNTGDVVSVTVTMDEATTVTGTPQLDLNIGGSTVKADYVSGSGTTELVFKYTIQAGQSDANGVSINENSLSLNGGTLQDAGGNNAALTHSAVTDNGSYMVDATAPSVQSVAITEATGAQNNTLNAGDVVSVTVTMDEATIVTGTPQLNLNIGGTSVLADFASGSGTTSLVFKYTITNETDANGISINENSLSLNGGTLTDAAGNEATLTFGSVADNGSYMVDTTTPTVDSVAITNATGIQSNTLNAGDVVSVTVSMNEATTVTGTPQISLNIGGAIVQATYASGNGSTSLVFQYTIQAGQTDANGISVVADSLDLNGGTLTDPAGHDATLAHNAVADNGSYMVDTTAPSVNSVAISGATGMSGDTLDDAGDTVSITVTMDQATTVTGTPRLALNIGGTTKYADYKSGSGSTELVFTYTLESNLEDTNGISIDVNSLSLNSGALRDAAGNDASLTHGAISDNASYKVDTAPSTREVEITANGQTPADAYGGTFFRAGEEDIVKLSSKNLRNIDLTGFGSEDILLVSRSGFNVTSRTVNQQWNVNNDLYYFAGSGGSSYTYTHNGGATPFSPSSIIGGLPDNLTISNFGFYE